MERQGSEVRVVDGRDLAHGAKIRDRLGRPTLRHPHAAPRHQRVDRGGGVDRLLDRRLREQAVGLLDRVALEQREREERRGPDPRPHDLVAVADLERCARVRLGLQRARHGAARADAPQVRPLRWASIEPRDTVSARTSAICACARRTSSANTSAHMANLAICGPVGSSATSRPRSRPASSRSRQSPKYGSRAARQQPSNTCSPRPAGPAATASSRRRGRRGSISATRRRSTDAVTARSVSSTARNGGAAVGPSSSSIWTSTACALDRASVPHEQLAQDPRQPDPDRRRHDELERLAQVIGCRRIARERLGLAELPEHDAARVVPGRLAQRPPQQPDGRLRRAVGERRPGGLAQQHHDRGVAGRLPAQQMGSDASAPRALAGEHQAGAPVTVGERRRAGSARTPRSAAAGGRTPASPTARGSAPRSSRSAARRARAPGIPASVAA